MKLTKDQRTIAEAELRLLARDLSELVDMCSAGSAMVRVFVDGRGRHVMVAKVHKGTGGLEMPQEIIGLREGVADG